MEQYNTTIMYEMLFSSVIYSYKYFFLTHNAPGNATDVEKQLNERKLQVANKQNS